jgi:hypothetical protein
MLADPVAALFTFLAPLTNPSSTDNATVSVPIRLPAVMEMRWLLTNP